MDPTLKAALLSWDWRIDVILVLASAGILYTWGWWRLRQKTAGRVATNRWHMGAAWRPVAYLGGLLLIALALLSPIDVLSSQLFTLHMVQHILLVMLAPPLLLLANPLPFILWGLPAGARREVGQWLGRNGILRRFLKKTTGPGLVWLYFVIVYWGWHDPSLYDAALRSGLLHDLEHITFIVASTLFWWQVIAAGPRVHRPLPPLARIGYLLAAIPPSMLAGIAISFAGQPIYEHYEFMPRLWGLSVMADQQLAGVIMWVPGSMMYIVAVLLVAGRWLQSEEDKPALPESEWATEEALLAPGMKK